MHSTLVLDLFYLILLLSFYPTLIESFSICSYIDMIKDHEHLILRGLYHRIISIA
jgi:hypothetical protein